MNKLKSGGFTAAACLLITFGSAPSVFANCCLHYQTVTVTFSVPGASSTAPTSINSSGSVAGYYVTAPRWWSLGGSYGFVRDLNGTITTFAGPGGGAIPGYWTSGPGRVLIDDAGLVAGSYYDANGVIHGFVGNPKVAGGIVSFDPPGSTQTIPTGINGSGSVTGSFLDANGVSHGFLYVGGTSYTIDYPMARSTHAWSVTSQGFIVGFYNDQNGTQNGFLCLLGCRSFPVGPWGDLYANSSLEAAGTIFEANNFAFGQLLNIQTGAGAGFELGNYGGGTYVQGINSSGVVVGFYIDNPNQEHAFLFEPNGTWSNGDPPGSNGNAKAMAINDAGAFTGTVGSLGFVTYPEVTPPCCIVAAP